MPSRRAEEAAGAVVGVQQLLDLGPERRVVATGPFQVGTPLGPGGTFEGLEKIVLRSGLCGSIVAAFTVRTG